MGLWGGVGSSSSEDWGFSRLPQIIGDVVKDRHGGAGGRGPARARTRGQRVLVEEGMELSTWEDVNFSRAYLAALSGHPVGSLCSGGRGLHAFPQVSQGPPTTCIRLHPA